MKKLNIVLLLLLGSLSLTAYSGPDIHPTDTLKVDSTKILGAPVYVWNQIFQDLRAGDAAELLVMQYEVELKKAAILQARSDTTLKEMKEVFFIAEREGAAWKEAYNIKDKQNEETHKEKRRYKRERNVAVLIAIGLGILGIAR